MWKVLFRARDRFARDQRGNVAILFAFTADSADRAARRRRRCDPASALQGGAPERHGRDGDRARPQRRPETTPRPTTSSTPTSRRCCRTAATIAMLHMQRFDAIEIEGGYRVVSDGYMDTAFLPVVGISEMPLDLETEVVMIGRQVRDRARARQHRLDGGATAASGRCATRPTQLVDDLYARGRHRGPREDGADPLRDRRQHQGTRTLRHADWIDPIGVGSRCSTSTSSEPRQPPRPLRPACTARVEGLRRGARRGDDEDDTLPASAATRWVPYLWPDEPDRTRLRQQLSDRQRHGQRLRPAARHRQIHASRQARRPTRSSRGPNAACPRPIVQLTNDTDLMQQRDPTDEAAQRSSAATTPAPTSRRAWSGPGAFSRPTRRSRQGVAYDDTETQKVLVLLSDGRNQIVAERRRSRESDYTSFGYLADGRLGTTDRLPRAAERNVDEKVARVCENDQGQGHPPLHDPLPGRLRDRRRTSSATAPRVDERRRAALSTTSRTPRQLRDRLQGHRQGSDDACASPADRLPRLCANSRPGTRPAFFLSLPAS